LLSGRPPEEAEPLAHQLLELTLASRGQARGWFVERFSAVAGQLKAEPARLLADTVLARLSETSDGFEFDALASGLVRLAGRLDSPAANQLAQCLLASLDPGQVAPYLALTRAFEPLAGKM